MNKNQLSKSNQEIRYQWYLDRVSEKREWAEKLSENMDKLVFAFSTGALILSVNFISNIINIYNIELLYLLKISWSLLIISATSVLVSMQMASESNLIDKNYLDKWIEGDTMKTPNFPLTLRHRLANWFDLLSKIALVLGIILMTYFVSFNIGYTDKQNNHELWGVSAKIDL